MNGIEELRVPSQVRISVVLLAVAWVLSAVLLVYKHFFLQVVASSPLGLALGIFGLLVQAIAIYFILRGSNIARILAVALLLLASPTAYFLVRSVAVASQPPVIYASILGYILKLVVVALLFFGGARSWFRRQRVQPSGT